MFEFFNFLITPLILSIIVSAAVMIISFKATKPSGCLMTGGVLLGGSIISIIASLYVETFFDSLVLSAPPIDDNVKIERIFKSSSANAEVDSRHFLKFLALTDGAIYSVFRNEDCPNDSRQDYLDCRTGSYAFFRFKRTAISECGEGLAVGEFRDHLTTDTNWKALRIETYFNESVPHLGAPVRHFGGKMKTPYYDVCIAITKVNSIPDDAWTTAKYDEQEYAYGYLLEKHTWGFRHHRHFYGDVPANYRNLYIDTEYCAHKSVDGWAIVMNTVFGPFFRDGRSKESWYEAKINMGCERNALAKHYRRY